MLLSNWLFSIGFSLEKPMNVNNFHNWNIFGMEIIIGLFKIIRLCWLKSLTIGQMHTNKSINYDHNESVTLHRKERLKPN